MNEDLKEKMRKALDRKKGQAPVVQQERPTREKAHGAEVEGGAAGPRVHRRKAGGGGS